MHSLPTIIFLLRLVHLKKFFKKLTKSTRLFSLAHTKHPLLQPLLQNYYHYTVNRFAKLKTRWMSNRQVC